MSCLMTAALAAAFVPQLPLHHSSSRACSSSKTAAIVCQLDKGQSSPPQAHTAAAAAAGIDVSSAVASANDLLLKKKCFISIAGIIGAGKSTLATALGTAIGLPVFYEPIADNEYLDDFYKDMKAYAFPLQIHLLNRRFRQQQEIVWSDAGAIQDRSIYEDAVFARMLADDGLMDERDYETYYSLFTTMSRFMQRPDVVIYLDVSPEESFRRIELRQRACESGMTLDYLIKLHAAYEVFIRETAKSMHVIRIDYSKYRDADEMVAEIARQMYDTAPSLGVDWAIRERS